MFGVTDKVRRNVLVSSDHGIMIVNRFDCNHQQVGHGQWLLDHGSVSTIEANETYKCLMNVESPVILDIGANIGTYTTWMAKLLPTSKIYSFEAQRLVFQMLCGNLAINNFDNCYTYNMAVGKTNGFITVSEPNYYSNEDFGIFSLIEEKIKEKSGNVYNIPLITIDSFVEMYNIDKVDFMKIDVEGMDLDVLQGATNTISKYKPHIFIEHSDNRTSILENIVSYLGIDKYNYTVIGNNLLVKPK